MEQAQGGGVELPLMDFANPVVEGGAINNGVRAFAEDEMQQILRDALNNARSAYTAKDLKFSSAAAVLAFFSGWSYLNPAYEEGLRENCRQLKDCVEALDDQGNMRFKLIDMDDPSQSRYTDNPSGPYVFLYVSNVVGANAALTLFFSHMMLDRLWAARDNSLAHLVNLQRPLGQLRYLTWSRNFFLTALASTPMPLLTFDPDSKDTSAQELLIFPFALFATLLMNTYAVLEGVTSFSRTMRHTWWRLRGLPASVDYVSDTLHKELIRMLESSARQFEYLLTKPFDTLSEKDRALVEMIKTIYPERGQLVSSSDADRLLSALLKMEYQTSKYYPWLRSLVKYSAWQGAFFMSIGYLDMTSYLGGYWKNGDAAVRWPVTSPMWVPFIYLAAKVAGTSMTSIYDLMMHYWHTGELRLSVDIKMNKGKFLLLFSSLMALVPFSFGTAVNKIHSAFDNDFAWAKPIEGYSEIMAKIFTPLFNATGMPVIANAAIRMMNYAVARVSNTQDSKAKRDVLRVKAGIRETIKLLKLAGSENLRAMYVRRVVIDSVNERFDEKRAQILERVEWLQEQLSRIDKFGRQVEVDRWLSDLGGELESKIRSMIKALPNSKEYLPVIASVLLESFKEFVSSTLVMPMLPLNGTLFETAHQNLVGLVKVMLYSCREETVGVALYEEAKAFVDEAYGKEADRTGMADDFTMTTVMPALAALSDMVNQSVRNETVFNAGDLGDNRQVSRAEDLNALLVHIHAADETLFDRIMETLIKPVRVISGSDPVERMIADKVTRACDVHRRQGQPIEHLEGDAGTVSAVYGDLDVKTPADQVYAVSFWGALRQTFDAMCGQGTDDDEDDVAYQQIHGNG